MKTLRSLTTRLVLSHVFVATMSMAIVFSAFAVVSNAFSNEQFNHDVAIAPAIAWRMGEPDGGPMPVVKGVELTGFGLVVSPDGEVLYSQGNTACRSGASLVDCAPDLIDLPIEERIVRIDGVDQWQSVASMPGGGRIISRRIYYNAEPRLRIGGVIDATGYIPVALIFSIAGALAALPIASIIALIWVRLQTQRIRKVAQASRDFAAGDLHARVGDRRHDMLGGLGQQFDSMADALGRNIADLRHLAQRNAELAHEAEQAAANMERARVSRDLHDSIAQQLFNVSLGAATLPELIDTQRDESARQAQTLAGSAEDILLRLRRVIVDLRANGGVS